MLLWCGRNVKWIVLKKQQQQQQKEFRELCINDSKCL